MTKFCEICQIKVEKDINLLNNAYKLKMSDFLPQIDLHLTQNSVICDQCFTQITDTQEFKQLQVKNESNVNDVPCNSNFKDQVTNTVCVKEEPGVENINEEFNVGLIKEEVCELEILKDDLLVNVNNEKNHCHDCGWCTNNKKKLIQHIAKQHRKEGSARKDLVRKPTNEKIYQCDKCYHKFTRRGNLKAHIFTKHTGEKPYQCDKCDYKSTRRTTLKVHQLSHTGEYPYQCEKCDYKCGRKSSMTIHRFIHTGEYPFKCDKCDYKSTGRYHLEMHVLSKHTSEKPHQCDKCDYRTVRRYNLKKHKLSHAKDHTGVPVALL